MARSRAAAELSIRPHALLLAPRAGRPDALVGCVSKAAYLGSQMEYWVAVDGFSKDLFVIAQDVERPFAAGDEVAVTLTLGGVALLPQHWVDTSGADLPSWQPVING